MNYQILVVEDNPQISSIVIKYLEKEGYNPTLAENGVEALACFTQNKHHLVLLDIMMPGIDGMQVLKEIRAVSEVPVIMLTAKGQEPDRIKGFDAGADDYVVKPFSPRELMRRVQVLLRRVYGDSEPPMLQYGALILYPTQMKLMKNGEVILLTTNEFHLLHMFMRNQGAVLTREQLMTHAFGSDYDGYDRSIDSHIKRIRQKIEDDPKNPKYLQTKYGAGYQFGGDQS